MDDIVIKCECKAYPTKYSNSHILVHHKSKLNNSVNFSHLLNPRYTWPKVPLPRSFPFFHFDNWQGECSIVAEVLNLGKVEGLVGEPGGRGRGWHMIFPSSHFSGESRLVPENRGWRGDEVVVATLDPGPGLLGGWRNLVSSFPLLQVHNQN